MRWPFRRRRREPAPTPALAPGLIAVPGAPPRADWARLGPTAPTASRRPPTTFNGARFGRSVAGARPMAAIHRPIPPGRAPSGVIRHAARPTSVIPPALDDPSAEAPSAPAAPVGRHRRLPRAAKEPVEALMAPRGDTGVPRFAAVPERSAPAPTRIAWTAEGGFVGHPTEPAVDDRSDPQLRFVPTTTPRPTHADWHGMPDLDLQPAPTAIIEHAPREVAEVVRAATGVDVADTPIDRSPHVSARAARIGAIAYTEQGVVHLPADHGPLDAPTSRAVVAHELTHVAQQRRRPGPLPAEGTAEGRALEAEAQATQHTAARGAAVRPTFLRSVAPERGALAGVQRLADDDPYAWQGRPMTEGEELTTLFGDHGYAWAPGSARARRNATADRTDREEFEHSHAGELYRQRDTRWAELVLESDRIEQTTAAREGRSVRPLQRDDHVALRRLLDQEMPFEFGFPPLPQGRVEHYPVALPPAPETTTQTERTTAAGPQPTGAGRHRPTSGRRPGAGTSTGRQLPVTGRGSPGSGHGPSRRGESQFEWQQREPTAREEASALFGDGLFGMLLGHTISDEDERDSRRATETAQLDALLEQRRAHERQLRHRTLREKHTAAIREPAPAPREGEPTSPSRFPIPLTDDEIGQIRAEVDREMPLEFHAMRAEDYLRINDESQITQSGEFEERTPPAPEPTPTPPPTSGQHPGQTPTPMPPPTPAATLAPTDTPPPTGAPAPTATAAATPVPTTATLAAPARAGAGMAGAAVGATVGAGVASLLDDSDTPDELMARRVFAAATDLDVDALTRRIYGRIRRELRSELLVDRERSGVLADSR